MQADQVLEHSAYAMMMGIVAQLPWLALALALLGVTYVVVILVNRLLRRALARTPLRRNLGELVVEVTDVAIWLLMLFLAIGIAFPSVTPVSILTGLGLGSVAIGFAFRDIFENFLAGILILYREPFRIGDFIHCSAIEGYVEEITARDTHLRQTDGERVVLPNAMLLKNQVTVRTDREVRRTTTFCRVDLRTDADQAREVIEQTVKGLATVSPAHEVQIFARAFVEGGVEFEITWWTGSRPVQIRRSRDEVIREVKRRLEAAGIPLLVPRRLIETAEPPAEVGLSPSAARSDPDAAAH